MRLRGLLTFGLACAALQAHAAGVDFDRDVRPILRDNCWECHGAKEKKGSLRLDRKRFAMVGGDRENIVPGAPERSRVFRAIAGLEDTLMPEDGALTDEQIETIRTWIAEGAHWPDDPPDQQWTTDPRVPALLRHLSDGKFGAVRTAVAADPALAKARDEHGVTLLAQAALYSRASELRWLLAHGAEVDAKDGAGHTPLMLAIEDPVKLRVLLDAGADANARTEAGRTVLQQAADQRRSAAVIALLLEHGANPKKEEGESDVLIQVIRNGDLEAAKLLVAARGGKLPREALNAAASSNNIDVLRHALAELKPGKPALSKTLSSVAIMAKPDIYAALLEAGADPNYLEPESKKRGNDKESKTILMKAVYSDYADPARVALLLKHGADVNAKSSRGSTALAEARKKGNSAVVAALMAAGAQE